MSSLPTAFSTSPDRARLSLVAPDDGRVADNATGAGVVSPSALSVPESAPDADELLERGVAALHSGHLQDATDKFVKAAAAAAGSGDQVTLPLRCVHLCRSPRVCSCRFICLARCTVHFTHTLLYYARFEGFVWSKPHIKQTRIA